MSKKVTITVLKDEIFSVGEVPDKTTVENKKAELEEKYKGRISFAKAFVYVPVLSKDGD